MTCPYGPGPVDLQTKDLRSITPAQAYRLASPAQRWLWFGDEPPPELETKALPSAAPVGLPPELNALVEAHRHDHVGVYDPGPCTHAMANPAELWNGKCAIHRPG
jgi:hypothetical protein